VTISFAYLYQAKFSIANVNVLLWDLSFYVCANSVHLLQMGAMFVINGYSLLFDRKLDELPDGSNCDRPSPESFSKLEKFDTDIQGCLGDPKKALSYQTGWISRCHNIIIINRHSAN